MRRSIIIPHHSWLEPRNIVRSGYFITIFLKLYYLSSGLLMVLQIFLMINIFFIFLSAIIILVMQLLILIDWVIDRQQYWLVFFILKSRLSLVSNRFIVFCEPIWLNSDTLPPFVSKTILMRFFYFRWYSAYIIIILVLCWYNWGNISY